MQSLAHLNGWMQKKNNNARAAQCSPCGVAACRAVLAKHWRWMVLAHMVEMVTQGQCNKGEAGMGSRQRQANKAWQMQGMANTDQQLQHNTGRHSKLTGLWSGPVRLWRECSGAVRSRNRLGPNLLSPPNLSPLPVFVHTHSLSLQQENNKI